MNREDVLKMEAGRAFDRDVAAYVFGCIPVRNLADSDWECQCIGKEHAGTDDISSLYGDIAPYSTDIASAWLVVDKMIPLIVRVENITQDQFRAVFFDKHSWDGEVELYGKLSSDYADAKTAALAICRAALLATLSAPNIQQKEEEK